jgi:hypothetical protein
MLRKILHLVAWRFLNSWIAAAIAHREQQAALIAQQQLDYRQLDKTRLYRGPIGQLFAKAASFRKGAA